jgi:hypothetical protein
MDFTRQRIHIETAPAQQKDAVMAVQNGPVGPGLQAAFASGYQRLSQEFSGKAIQLIKLRRAESTVGMEGP